MASANAGATNAGLVLFRQMIRPKFCAATVLWGAGLLIFEWSSDLLGTSAAEGYIQPSGKCFDGEVVYVLTRDITDSRTQNAQRYNAQIGWNGCFSS